MLADIDQISLCNNRICVVILTDTLDPSPGGDPTWQEPALLSTHHNDVLNISISCLPAPCQGSGPYVGVTSMSELCHHVTRLLHNLSYPSRNEQYQYDPPPPPLSNPQPDLTSFNNDNGSTFPVPGHYSVSVSLDCFLPLDNIIASYPLYN